jgi:uncharacterized protein
MRASPKWFAAAAIGCSGIAVLGLAVAPLRQVAHAQSADLVLCDRLAADPTDPDKPADVKGAAVVAPSDIATAIKFCKQAAASSRRALYELGRAYAANGQGAEAAVAYRKAADKGSTAAMVELAALLASGSGVPKDADLAHKLLQRAAAAGNPRAISNLAAGGVAAGGSGTPADPVQARSLLEKAAEANSADAQLQLGIMMAEGTGGPKDDIAARTWFEKAAAQGLPEALDWAGNFAEGGRGGPQDTNAAKAYYEKAAALGNEDAKAALERLRCPYVLKTKSGQVWTRICP